MIEWIAGLISYWPVWIVLSLVVIVGLAWAYIEATGYGINSSFRQKEWWQDKERRLASENEKRVQSKTKVKKG